MECCIPVLNLHAVVVERVARIPSAGPEHVLEGSEAEAASQQGAQAQPPVVTGQEVVTAGSHPSHRRALHRL